VSKFLFQDQEFDEAGRQCIRIARRFEKEWRAIKAQHTAKSQGENITGESKANNKKVVAVDPSPAQQQLGQQGTGSGNTNTAKAVVSQSVPAVVLSKVYPATSNSVLYSRFKEMKLDGVIKVLSRNGKGNDTEFTVFAKDQKSVGPLIDEFASLPAPWFEFEPYVHTMHGANADAKFQQPKRKDNRKTRNSKRQHTVPGKSYRDAAAGQDSKQREKEAKDSKSGNQKQQKQQLQSFRSECRRKGICFDWPAGTCKREKCGFEHRLF
jgi:hypothetical protein